MTMRYLTQDEKANTRSLYQQCFPEDSQEFLKYYYSERIRDNEILVLEDSEEKECQVMIHLNPHELSLWGQQQTIHYIVAVATAPSARGQGKMRQVLHRSLRDLAAQKEPFTFLMPADPKFYRSSGFVEVPVEDYSDWQMKSIGDLQAASLDSGNAKLWHLSDIPEIMDFSNQLLAEKYQVYRYRSPEYYMKQFVELAAEDGDILLVRDGDQEDASIIGLAVYGKDGDQIEFQELLTSDENQELLWEALEDYFPGCQLSIPKMPCMIRILDLFSLIPLLRRDSALDLWAALDDSIIPENQGNFHIEVTEEYGRITAISPEEVREQMSIEGLSQLLFNDISIHLREWV